MVISWFEHPNGNAYLRCTKLTIATMNYDLIVIGSGPGGYVAAIRASQLGLKTAIVEKENLGGVCLNWGCIPTKALIKSAQVFDYINHASDYGISVTGASHDFGAVISRSRGVADGMSKGVQFLLKKNKIDVINGHGKIREEKKWRLNQLMVPPPLMKPIISFWQRVLAPANCPI